MAMMASAATSGNPYSHTNQSDTQIEQDLIDPNDGKPIPPRAEGPSTRTDCVAIDLLYEIES